MDSIAWASMREWQIKNKKKIVDIQKLRVHEQLIIIKELFCIGREKLKDMLASSKVQSEILLDIAFEKAFKLFLEHKDVQLLSI